MPPRTNRRVRTTRGPASFPAAPAPVITIGAAAPPANVHVGGGVARRAAHHERQRAEREEGSRTGGSRRTSRTCPKRVLDKPTHILIHARGLAPTHIQGCHSTDLNEYSSLDQVPSNFMEVETSCDVVKYARLTEPGAVAGSGKVVVVRTSHHGVPRPNQGLP